MSSVPVKSLTADVRAQLACTYASLILHDEGLQITEKQLQKLVETAGVPCEKFWFKLVAKTLESRNVTDLLMSSGSSDQPAQQAGATTGATGAATSGPAQTNAPEPQKKVEEEEADMDMGDLFG